MASRPVQTDKGSCADDAPWLFWPLALALTVILLIPAKPVAGDYIAVVSESGRTGYLYIGKGAIKRQNLPGFRGGDLVIRDDTDHVCFTWAQARTDWSLPSPGQVREEYERIRRDLETHGESMPVDLLYQREPPEIRAHAVSYYTIRAYRHRLLNRALRRPDALAPPLTPPVWTNTGETAVVAGRLSTRYRATVVQPPARSGPEWEWTPHFSLDVWTTDLGPGYSAGHMFEKAYLLYEGGIPPLAVLADIPGFPMKMEVSYGRLYSHLVGRPGPDMYRIAYEVLELMETDLDENEFELPAGSRITRGRWPMSLFDIPRFQRPKARNARRPAPRGRARSSMSK